MTVVPVSMLQVFRLLSVWCDCSPCIHVTGFQVIITVWWTFWWPHLDGWLTTSTPHLALTSHTYGFWFVDSECCVETVLFVCLNFDPCSYPLMVIISPVRFARFCRCLLWSSTTNGHFPLASFVLWGICAIGNQFWVFETLEGMSKFVLLIWISCIGRAHLCGWSLIFRMWLVLQCTCTNTCMHTHTHTHTHTL